MPTVLLLRVAAAWPLPGLGWLVLPEGPASALAGYALHTALAVEAVLLAGARHPAMATVEEVTRPAEAAGPTRGLLLDLGGDLVLVPGTEIWLVSALPEA